MRRMQKHSNRRKRFQRVVLAFVFVFSLIVPMTGQILITPALAQSHVYRNRIGMEMILIPKGEFQMGSPRTEIGRDDDEEAHRVRLTRPFYMGRYEVTQGQWEALMGNNPSWFRNCSRDCPVEQVNWWEAVSFANSLSRLEQLQECYELKGCNGRPGANEDMDCESSRFKGLTCSGYRLPTEAEWEYAARARSRTPLYTPGYTVKGKNFVQGLDAIAWYAGNSGATYEGAHDCSAWEQTQQPSKRCGTHPVGQKKPNGFGLFDMLGNVYEWVADWYSEKYDRRSLAVDPLGPAKGFSRAYRGGSWRSLARFCRAAIATGMNRITVTTSDSVFASCEQPDNVFPREPSNLYILPAV